MTILIRSVRLFSDYLGKTRGNNSLHFRLKLPMRLSPDEFLVAVGRSIVQHSGLDGRVHFCDGKFSSRLIYLSLMDVGASNSVDS